MKNIKNNLIVSTSKIIAISAFLVMLSPFSASAGYVYSNGYVGYVRDSYGPVSNPIPAVDSISPNTGNIGTGGRTVNISGSGFVPGSVARVDGSNRATTFIDYSHLAIQLNADDMNRTNGFYITVWNGAPGGGYSNAALFTVNNNSASGLANGNSNNGNNNSYNNNTDNTSTNNNNTNNSNTDNNTQTRNTSSDTTTRVSNLASNAVFGSNSFLPSGLVQWVLFAIIILLLVILARKIFGGEQRYHEAPMKYD